MITIDSFERVKKAIDLDKPDKIPVDLHNFSMAADGMEYPFDKIFHSGELMAEAQIKAWENFHHDMLLLENGTTALAEAMGCEVVYPPDEPPRLVEPAFSNLSKVNELPLPDPSEDATLPELLQSTKLVKEELNNVFVMGRGDQGPFSLASMVIGMERFLKELSKGDNLNEIEDLLSHCTDVVETYIEAQFDSGADGSSIGDSIAGPDVCSPLTYREFAWPYEKELFSRLHKKVGLPVSLHICGDATSIVKDMVNTGADILELDYKVDLEEVRQATKNKTALLGPVNPSLFSGESTKKVYTESKRAIEAWKPGGGFILGPGCMLPSDSTNENIKAMFQARDEYK